MNGWRYLKTQNTRVGPKSLKAGGNVVASPVSLSLLIMRTAATVTISDARLFVRKRTAQSQAHKDLYPVLQRKVKRKP